MPRAGPADLLRLVHDAHAAAADLAEDPVIADLLGLLDRPPVRRTPPSPPAASLSLLGAICSIMTRAGNRSRICSA